MKTETDVVTTTANEITGQVLAYAPLVVAGMHAAEQSSMDGESKKQAVLDGIAVASQVMIALPVPQMQAIGGMINMFATIFNALGVFKSKPKTV